MKLRAHTLRHRLIVALDVDTLAEAESLVSTLESEVSFFKVGKQLFMHAGPEVVRMIHRHRAEVFLDLKFHDIPTTVAKAGVAAARLGVRFFDVHALGSLEMMERARSEVARVCRREGLRVPKILAVTVLTSLGKVDLRRVGVEHPVGDQVVRLARLARRAGINGVVASGREIGPIRRACGKGFLIVTPGIRPPAVGSDDQKRVLSPAEAMQAGADYLVIGRPVRDAHDPIAMVQEIIADMARGFLAGRTLPAVRA